jgi:hypothetical protein
MMARAYENFRLRLILFFKENQIYCGLLLPDSSSVYGTRLGGAVIIDQKEFIKYLINNKNGLPTNIVLGVTLDSEGNIWLSLDNGLIKFEINNAISLYNTNNGLEAPHSSYPAKLHRSAKLPIRWVSIIYLISRNVLKTSLVSCQMSMKKFQVRSSRLSETSNFKRLQTSNLKQIFYVSDLFWPFVSSVLILVPFVLPRFASSGRSLRAKSQIQKLTSNTIKTNENTIRIPRNENQIY